jgi:predicted GNAT family acetyltransferase
VSPLCALAAATRACAGAMVAMTGAGDEIAVFGPQMPATPAGFEVFRQMDILQMIRRDRARLPPPAIAFDVLGDGDVDDMLALVELTRPGPFCRRTIDLGRFLGVRDAGRLVAMAGERMWIDDHREVSGVCTHPDAQGRGIARALMAAVIDRMLDAGQVPFLHVEAAKAPVIAFYRSLGFEPRAAFVVTGYRRVA